MDAGSAEKKMATANSKGMFRNEATREHVLHIMASHGLPVIFPSVSMSELRFNKTNKTGRVNHQQ